MFDAINRLLEKIKREKPLILNVTNDVTMDFIANGLLCVGASPVVTKAKQEIKDLMRYTQAVVINLRTLDDEFIDLCEHVCHWANKLKKPIILDPVGAGASQLRTQACLTLLRNHQIAIVRGNASEIGALSGLEFASKNVDNKIRSENAIESAKFISLKHQAAIVISGEIDIILDANKINRFHYGTPMMSLITGTGCLLSAIISAFHAVEKNRVNASSAATIFYGVCGEIASENIQGPGTFKARFLDALYSIPDHYRYVR